MPKSRGRHPSKRKPSRRTQPTSYESQAFTLAAELLSPEATRVQAELLASEVLGDLTASAKGAARERRTQAVDRLLLHAGRRRTRSAAALLAAVELVTQNPRVREALDEWARAEIEDLSWPSQPTPLPTGARTIPDEYDDHVIWLLDYDDCVLAAATSRAFHQGVVTVSLLKPGPISPEIDRDAKPVALDVAVRALSDGQQYTEMLEPPHLDDDYVIAGALLSGRLRAIELPEIPDVPWQPLPDDDKQVLIDAFFAAVTSDLFVDDAQTRRLARLCLDYADEHLDGDRMAWSPEIVDVFLSEQPPDEEDALPIVTYEWVRWSLLQRGLSEALAIEAAEVALSDS